MMTTLITAGTWALGLVGGPIGILGVLGGLFRIPFIGGAVAAIPVVGPVLAKACEVVLGWLDAAVRFLARCVGALLKAVSSDYRVAIPVVVMLWGYHMYYDKWKYRDWESPAAVSELKKDVAAFEKETKKARPSRRKSTQPKFVVVDPLDEVGRFFGIRF